MLEGRSNPGEIPLNSSRAFGPIHPLPRRETESRLQEEEQECAF